MGNKNFKIDFIFTLEKHVDRPLLELNLDDIRIKQYNLDIYGKIKFFIGSEETRKLPGDYCMVTKDGYVKEYLGDFFIGFDKLIKGILEQKKISHGFFDSGQAIIFVPKKDIVYVSFDYDFDVNESNIVDIPVPLAAVVEGLIDSLDRFIKKILKINPKVVIHPKVVRLIKEKEIAAELWKKYKSKKEKNLE